ncbi:MAG: methyltransferase domain-containing protein [Bacteroidetes bacterium]|nr:methyltransferase domain-containing protein [Bacteroidota bacterium]
MNKYPAAFTDRMRAHFGADYEAFIAALDEPPVTSVRTHLSKFQQEATTLPLGDRIPWATAGYYLSSRPSFTFDPLFHAGAYYVQESSSMFLEQALKATGLLDKPIRVLDMCAAPGGKSTHILSLLNSESLLVSNEIIASRNHILRQNLARWGYANSIVTQNKAEDFAGLGETFDIIVVDAPCSGEGLFRKDKAAIEEWSEANVAMCAERQEDILKNLIQCLKPGGYLIYSTCTYENAENMQHVERLTQEGSFESIAISEAKSFEPQLTNVSKDGLHGYAFYPHCTRGEGFFISLLRKGGEWRETKHIPPRIADKTISEIRPQLDVYIADADQLIAVKHQGIYNILPAKFWQDYRGLSRLYIRNAGICAGEIKGKDLIPAHELSLYQGLKDDFPAIDIDHSAAISFLKGETVSAPTDLKGWVIIRHKGLGLGFAKALPNRINSYFPKEWRILKSQP